MLKEYYFQIKYSIQINIPPEKREAITKEDKKYRCNIYAYIKTFYHELEHAVLGLKHVSQHQDIMRANHSCKGPKGNPFGIDYESPKSENGWYTALKFMFTKQKADHCYLNDKNPPYGQTANELYCPGEVENTNNTHFDENAIYCSQGARIN